MSSTALLMLFFLGMVVFPSALQANHAQTHLAEHTHANTPSIVWLRPPEIDLTIDGVTIVDGPLFENMVYLASHLPQYSHRFEAYPIKRAWSLVKSATTPDTVYCFFGASYREERTTWGYFSEPTSINLPLLVVTSNAVSDTFFGHEHDNNNPQSVGTISLKSMLQKNYKTVLYSEVKNAYVDVIKQWAKSRNIVYINGLGKDLSLHTISLIETGRIDFGYVGHREIGSLNEEQLGKIAIYQAEELSQDVRLTKRLFCSKSALGQQVVGDVNHALEAIMRNPKSSQALRDVNFAADGYSNLLKPMFDERWQTMQNGSK